MLVTDLRTIGERIYRFRKRLGLTQIQVAEKADLCERTYTQMERGYLNTRLQTFLKICDALRVTPDDILVDEDTQKENLEVLFYRLNNCNADQRRTAYKMLEALLDSLGK